MSNIFLESHNIDNQFFGFGQFNKHLILALHKEVETLEANKINITVTSKHKKSFDDSILKDFNYKAYNSLQRKPFFRVKKKYHLWHSLNQNTKIEPFYNIPYLLTIHDVNFMEELTGKALEKRVKRFNIKLNKSHAITYISNYAKAMTHKYFKVPDVPEYVIYNGCAKIAGLLNDNYLPKFKSNKPYLFFIGEFLEKKNIHTLIEMMPFLEGYDLVLAGKNSTVYAEKCNTIVEKLNLKNRVHILGKISEEDKFYHYKNCKAFVFPSLREGFGLPPIEAMQFGTPVVLSNKSALPEIGGKLAKYWTNFEPKYMAETVTECLDNYNTKKAKALIDYANSYSWETTAKEYISVYKSLLFK